ncbi:MAG: hypothetical protein HF981_19570 [Desulfobacteraceae bacterium]|nr:hypothetical protein [Desulfobacteraceae bacterium]MBC2752601.1 hypothetical protein [Desulfobacteraceae bacterium]
MPKPPLPSILQYLVLFSVIILSLVSCGDNDNPKAYMLLKVDPKENYGHEWLPINISTYRVKSDSVVHEIAGMLVEYNRCTILDKDNWECTYSDKFGSFGFRDGDYWERPKLVNSKVVSRWEYNKVRCDWCMNDKNDGVFWGSVKCVTGWE